MGSFFSFYYTRPQIFLTIVDDFSRFTWIVLLKGKYEVALKLQEFIISVEVQFDAKIKTLRSDNGP
jgi:hypothetical protein